MAQLVNPLEVLKSISDATTALVQKLAPSVVSVKTHMSHGTGIVLNREGYIVTCNHVLAGCNAVRIGQGEKTCTAIVVATDPYNDIVLLKAEQSNFKPAILADSAKLGTGQFVMALANPFNRNTPTATTGIITNPDATLRNIHGTAMENVIATDAQLTPGFSGGPIVDAVGRVVGMNVAYVWARGIAIPSNKIKAVADRLMQGTAVKRGYLGIVTNTVMIPQELADEAGLEQDTGVMIFRVEHGTPAKQSGLTMGDVIVKFNGKPVADFYDLPRLLADDVVGKETPITILRGEKLVTLTITPIALAEESRDE